MARLARVIAPGYPHHVTQRGVRSLPIFRNDEDRKMYLEFMARETKRYGVKILAWCLMTNHVHLIAVPKDAEGLARGIGEAHKRYSRMRNFDEGVRGYLFQGRFGSCVLDEKHLVAAVRYVERNPVRAGMVRVAWAYPWSSAKYHVGQRAKDVLVEEEGLWGFSGNWKEYVGDSREDEEAEIRNQSESVAGMRPNTQIRTATRTGRPWGEGKGLRKLERLTGRDLQKRKPGRPPRNVRYK
jgi:putative transposase